MKNPAFVIVDGFNKQSNILGPDGLVFGTVETDRVVSLVAWLNASFDLGREYEKKQSEVSDVPGPPDPARSIHPHAFA